MFPTIFALSLKNFSGTRAIFPPCAVASRREPDSHLLGPGLPSYSAEKPQVFFWLISSIYNHRRSLNRE